MSNEDVKFSVGAEDTGVDAALAHVSESVGEAVEGIKGKLESLNSSFEKIQAAFLAFTAVLAGGEAFKEAIDSSVNLVKESSALGRQFGMSATDASILKVALGSVFVSQDTLSAGASKITMALKKNESAFKDLGVATRDQNGDFRSTFDIMQDTNERLLQFKEGTDRNIEGTKIYGRAWAEVAPTLKLTKEAMEEARVTATSLGLVVGEQSVAQTSAYRKAMNGVHEVLEGVEVAIGNAVMPALTELGEWFESVGPSVVNGFKAALFTLGGVFLALKAVVTEVYDFIKGNINVVVEAVVGAANVMHAAITPGESVSAAWAETGARMATATKTAWKEMQDDAEAYGKSVEELQEKLAGDQTPIAKKTGGESSDGGDDKLKSQMAEYQAELAAAKEHYEESESLNGHFVAYTTQQEIAFWQAKLAIATKGSGDAQRVQENINKLEYDERKQAHESELADLKSQEAQYKNNLQAKLQLAVEYANKVAATEGADSPKAKAAQAEVLALDRQIDAQRLELAKITQTSLGNLTLSGIDIEEKASQAKLVNHQITDAQMLVLAKQYEAERLAIKTNALQQEIALANTNPGENEKLLAQLNAQKLDLMAQYTAKVAALNLKAADDSAKDWKKTFTSLTQGFGTVISGMLQGTETFQGAIQSMYKTITGIIAQTVSQMVTTWLQGEVSKLIASKTGAATSVADNAAVAGAAAFASTAAIPYVGPELAPAAGAAAFSEAMAFGAGLSAAGGFDIPANVNPVVQTHAKEMILPAEHADTIRSLRGNQGAGNSARSDKLMQREFRKQSAQLIKQMRRSTNRLAI